MDAAYLQFFGTQVYREDHTAAEEEKLEDAQDLLREAWHNG